MRINLLKLQYLQQLKLLANKRTRSGFRLTFESNFLSLQLAEVHSALFQGPIGQVISFQHSSKLSLFLITFVCLSRKSYGKKTAATFNKMFNNSDLGSKATFIMESNALINQASIISNSTYS